MFKCIKKVLGPQHYLRVKECVPNTFFIVSFRLLGKIAAYKLIANR